MNKKKVKGFTLVELLAVIVILAVILVIAMPKISDVIKKTRLSSLEATTKMIINFAEKKYTENQVLEQGTNINCSDVAKLNKNDYGICKITFDDKGNASVILNGKKDGKFDNLTCSGTKGNITCSEGQTEITLKCVTGKSSLTQGDEYVNGQYTYRYKEEHSSSSSFLKLSDDGWSVYLTDKSSTAPVTSELCSSIDDKPIVSMSYMFEGSQAISLDLSSFDTSNVKHMKWMFSGSAATSLDLSNFNTSNVTDMSYMFEESQAISLDLSSFDTSNVKDMSSMFSESQATNLDLSKFNTSNVIDMSWMFSRSQATSLDLSSFDTSNVKDMSSMFYSCEAKNLNLSSFDTSKVTNMGYMFSGSAATSLDLSSFDTSSVTNMKSMFSSSVTTTGYAKTCEDASRFNSSSGKPNTLTFTVKDTTC